MQKIVGVRRVDDKNIYYFTAGVELELDSKVVVNFDELDCSLFECTMLNPVVCSSLPPQC